MNPLQEFHRLRKFLFCLARESHDDVRGQGRMGEFFPEKIAALCIFFRGIATVHPLQGGVAAALQGQVEMRTELRHLCQHFRKFFCDNSGFQGAQTNAVDTLYPIHCLNQGQEIFSFQIHTVGA